MSNFYDLETDLDVEDVSEQQDYEDISEFAAFDAGDAESRWGQLDFTELVNELENYIATSKRYLFFSRKKRVINGEEVTHLMQYIQNKFPSEVTKAKNIIAEVEKSKVKFMIGQVCRYAPGFALAKRLVDQGAIGELYFVESEYAHNYNSAKGVNNWRVDARREPFVGGGCHAVDLLRWVAGEAYEVSAFANHKCLADWPVNDCTIAIYKFANNVIGKVLVSIGCVRPYTMRSCFYGTEGTIICDNTSPDIKICSRKFMAGKLDFASMPVNIANHNVSAEIADFMKCIINDTPVETSIYEGARTVAAALAAAESAKLGGQPVKIEQL